AKHWIKLALDNRIMNHISPVNHPESALSGSTIESMIDKAVSLSNTHFAATDHGYLTSILKGYSYSKKKDIKFIAGIELYFKDSDCPIIKNTPSEQIKYFKIVVHAKDQEAYQAIVKSTSDLYRKKITIGENHYPVFNWQDLEHLAKYNITLCTSNVECMVAKHLLVNRADLGLKYYEKLRNLVGPDNFYPTILPFKHDKYWNSVVRATVGDIQVDIPPNDRIETDRYSRARAFELTRKNNRHKELKKVYLNKMGYSVASQYKNIGDAELINEFQYLPGGDIQTKANQFVMALAKRYGDMENLLINNYSYYANRDDKVVQDMKLGKGNRIAHYQFMASVDDIGEYLGNELGLTTDDYEALAKNSLKWAKQFDNFELKYGYRLPKPDGDPQEILLNTIKKVGRMKWDDPVYVAQFREEFELLTNNGVINLIPYFLPIIDIYDYYKENGGLTAPGRGSSAGFLISYLIGITHLDPIKYGLSSSRFLTLDRVQQGNIPDFDADLENRELLTGPDGNSGYLYKKYGNKAAQISTRTLLRIKSAILDASRFVNGGTVEESATKLSKSLPNTPQGVNDYDFVFGYEDNEGSHIEGLLEKNDNLQKYMVDRPEEWNIVKRALSLSRQYSRHACAHIISDAPIEDTIPIFEVGGVKRITQPEAKQCEEAGLIKYDFLVVSALKDINLCLRYINKKNSITTLETGHFIHNDTDTFIWDLPEDQGVFKMLSDGDTETIFQLNTVSVTPFVKQIKPQSIIDCATITSLVRPGPLDFKDEKTGRNMVQEYVERRLGRSKSDIPVLEKMLPETYGVLVFQEQVTKLAKELAGMDVIDSENVRIAVGKKKKKLIDSLKPIFIEGAAKKTGIETATKIWDMMETFARYGFNINHAMAYSAISYSCAFLKHHYPLEWWAAVLSNAEDKEINEVFYKYIRDTVLPPDINTSNEQMEVDYTLNKIRNKLSIVSGLGPAAADKIVKGRPYKDIKDFTDKKVCGPAMAQKLIHIGVLDSLFDSDDDLYVKISKYEVSVRQTEWECKLREYDEKIKNAKDEKEKIRITKNKDKLKLSGPKEPDVDSKYLGLTLKKDFQMKKAAYPTMNLNLQPILEKNSSLLITDGQYKLIANEKGKDFVLLSGESLQQIDNSNVKEDVYFCTPGYVIEASEFSYAGGSKRALKMIIDSSGYISEKVVWPDYNTGRLKYPKELKKGSIVYFFYSKRVGKPYTNIIDIYVEEDSIL
ncbi:MAG: PHP domain-containing protein, partial [Candidatus Njordarchaeales archaeon]